MGDWGPTSTHHCNEPVADWMRRTNSPGLMNEIAETLGRPPASHVAAVSRDQGTIHTETSTALAQMSRGVRVRGRGAAAIAPRHSGHSPRTLAGQFGFAIADGASDQRAERSVSSASGEGE